MLQIIPANTASIATRQMTASDLGIEPNIRSNNLLIVLPRNRI